MKDSLKAIINYIELFMPLILIMCIVVIVVSEFIIDIRRGVSTILSIIILWIILNGWDKLKEWANKNAKRN